MFQSLFRIGSFYVLILNEIFFRNCLMLSWWKLKLLGNLSFCSSISIFIGTTWSFNPRSQVYKQREVNVNHSPSKHSNTTTDLWFWYHQKVRFSKHSELFVYFSEGIKYDFTHTPTHIHTRVRTHTHTHTHPYIYIYIYIVEAESKVLGDCQFRFDFRTKGSHVVSVLLYTVV